MGRLTPIKLASPKIVPRVPADRGTWVGLGCPASGHDQHTIILGDVGVPDRPLGSGSSSVKQPPHNGVIHKELSAAITPIVPNVSAT